MAQRAGRMLEDVSCIVDIMVHGVGTAEFCVSLWFDEVLRVKLVARIVKIRQEGVEFYSSGGNKQVNATSGLVKVGIKVRMRIAALVSAFEVM